MNEKQNPDIGRWCDTPDRYGLASRIFHWVIAYLLVWQFVTLIGWRLIGDGSIMRTVSLLGPSHGTVGVLVLAVLLPRMVWAWRSRRRRPTAGGMLGRAARVMHRLLYALVFAVPSLALLRAYGNGKGYGLWGLQLVPETGVEVGWLTAPANLLHGPLAWTLAVLIAGHAVAALTHHFVLRDRTLLRMAGSIRR